MPSGPFAALKCSGFEPTNEYRKYCNALASALLYDGPFEPKYHRDASCQQQRGDHGRYKLGWQGGDKLAFLEAAKRLPHPAQHESDDLPADLCAAVRFAVGKGGDIVEWRRRAVALCCEAANALWELSEQMISSAPEHVRHLWL